MSKRMSPAHYWLCRAILLLDKISLPMKWHQYWPPTDRPTYWKWTKGVFGTNVLVTRNWLDLYVIEWAYRRHLREVKRSNGQV